MDRAISREEQKTRERLAAHVHGQYVRKKAADGDLELEWQAHLRSIDGIAPYFRT
ncbi:MAG: hypothetical protein ACU0E9_02040 [Limimaricola soesokkakensis]|uniref:hypothetical protein n=1 Tax=Limimaricola soesokkakensis TaxID=1343159 RepID=UPI00351655D6